MLNRRLLVGCALCSLGGLVASAAAAEAQPAAATGGIKRKILQQTDGPTPGYVTVIVEAEIAPHAMVARHTHPGIESGYIIGGSGELMVDGMPNRKVKAGDAFQIPVERPHSLKNGGKATKVTSTYIVEKGKPLASPA